MGKRDVVWNGILLSHKKDIAICDNMDGPRRYYTKPDKDKYKCGILKKKTKEQTKQNRNRPTGTENKLVVTRGGEWLAK